MKVSRFLRHLLLPFLFTVVPQAAFAQTHTDGANSGPPPSQRPGPSDLPGQLDFQTDLFAGRFGYHIPFDLAPGRHGSTPSLALAYNSANANGWCGVGWDLDLGYIQRETRHGVPVKWSNGAPVAAYDDAKGFVFCINGQSSPLVNVTDGEYRAEIQNNFLRFNYQTNNNQWLVTDKSGNQYTFGGTSGSRMTNPKSGWSSGASGTYRWAVSHLQTVLNDTADYTYTSINGGLYPLKLSYNGFDSSISTTHTIDFILETRSDVSVSFISGYRIEQNQRLAALVHKVSSQVVWSNRLAYTQSASTKRSLLQSVSRYGTDLASTLPPYTFSYSTQSFSFKPLALWTNMYLPVPPNLQDYTQVTSTSDGNVFADLFDMDGDGLPDRVLMPNYLYGPYTNLLVQHNNGFGFDSPVPFGRLSYQIFNDGVQILSSSNNPPWTCISSPNTRFLDINGDCLPDRVMDPIKSYSSVIQYPYTNLQVQLNSGTNFLSTNEVLWTNVQFNLTQPGDPASTWYYASEAAAVASGPLNQVIMLDMNGDGLPDRVCSRVYGSISNGVTVFTNYWVQFNNGSGFTGTNVFGFAAYDQPTPGSYGGTLSSLYVRLMDINGDGLPDRVMVPINPGNGQPYSCGSLSSYLVEYNNGYGFEPPVAFGGVIGQFTNAYNQSLVCVGSALQDAEDFAFADINGDGLPDRIIRYIYGASMTNWLVQINQGTNFAAPQLFGPYYSQNQYNDTSYSGIQSTFVRLIDINGDGLPDHVMPAYPSGTTNYLAVELSSGPFWERTKKPRNSVPESRQPSRNERL
jgi:hypothetical protein